MVRRNLAFKKRSGKEWTSHEICMVCAFCGDVEIPVLQEHTSEFIFDCGPPHKNYFMFDWEDKENLPNCTVMYYEDVFEKSALADIY